MGRLMKEVGAVKVRLSPSSLSLESPADCPHCQTSKTFPGQCGASLEAAICHLETVARVQARDLEGNLLHCGGDPLTAEVVSERGAALETSVTGLLQYK